MENQIYCENESMFCNRTYFCRIRTVIIEATCKYIKTHLVSFDDENKEDMTERKLLLSCFDEISEDSRTLDRFTYYCQKIFFVNLLSKFGIYGIFALCNKSDDNGYYKNGYFSIGNSYDICELFKAIKPFFNVDNVNLNSEDNFLYDSVISLEKIFQEGLDKKHIVTIK